MPGPLRARTGAGFRLLAEVDHPETLIPQILPWVHEASNPYVDWAFGGPEPARAVLEALMRTESSEISVRRVTGLLDGPNVIGGFIALGGNELETCAKADALRITLLCRQRDDFASVVERLAGGREHRGPVDEGEYFLSKMGVRRDFRGQRLGHALLAEFLATGRAAGYRRFRLDVSADNVAAVSVYHRAGFVLDGEHRHDGMLRLSMGLSDPETSVGTGKVTEPA
jgi:ribosomal protein S18 acetylase RimI-like enzyme